MKTRSRGQFHEDYGRSHVKTSSDRSFGLVFTLALAAIGLWPMKSGAGPRWWALVLSALFLLAGLFAPRVLAPLNRAWTQLGLLLGRVMTPIVMGIIFFLVITPMALLGRLRGRDPLRLKKEPEAASYWIERQPPGPPPESMERQF